MWYVFLPRQTLQHCLFYQTNTFVLPKLWCFFQRWSSKLISLRKIFLSPVLINFGFFLLTELFRKLTMKGRILTIMIELSFLTREWPEAEHSILSKGNAIDLYKGSIIFYPNLYTSKSCLFFDCQGPMSRFFHWGVHNGAKLRCYSWFRTQWYVWVIQIIPPNVYYLPWHERELGISNWITAVVTV